MPHLSHLSDHMGFQALGPQAVAFVNVATDRQGVTDAWTSPAAKDVVRRRGTELISYKDLADPSGPGRPGSLGMTGRRP